MRTCATLLFLALSSFATASTFTTSPLYKIGGTPVAMASGDLNGDHFRDLVVANESQNSVNILIANADGTFRPSKSFRTGLNPVSVAIADLNGDGKLDIVTADQQILSTVSVLLGNGDGTFPTHVEYSGSTGATYVGIADVNRDGKLDIVAVSPNNRPHPGAVSV